MYIEARKTKNKYKLYLCHSKRVDGKSTKPLNKYLFSIKKELLEPDPNNSPDMAHVIVESYFPDNYIDKALSDISDSIPEEIREDCSRSKKIFNLLCEKVAELIEKLN